MRKMKGSSIDLKIRGYEMVDVRLKSTSASSQMILLTLCHVALRTKVMAGQVKKSRHKRTNIARFQLYEVCRIGKLVQTESR